jgi:hypothetical protein
MRRLIVFMALASSVALACANISVSSDYDPTAKFSTYRSYAWLPENPTPTGHPRLDSPLVQERIKKAIDTALEAKGYTRTETPDFLVRYDLSAERRVDVTTYDSGFYHGYGYRMALPVTDVREYDVGSLILDVLDYREKKVVWRGIGQGRLRSEGASVDPAEQQERIDKAVAAVLKNFPPEPK